MSDLVSECIPSSVCIILSMLKLTAASRAGDNASAFPSPSVTVTVYVSVSVTSSVSACV